MREGALAGALDDGTVGERIAEGNAQLEDVRARVDGGHRDVVRRREVGIADGEVGDEAGLAGEMDRHGRLGSGEVEFAGEDAHVFVAAAGDVDDQDVARR